MASQDLQSKLNRAIRALLIAEGAGSAEDTFIEVSSDQRGLPNTSIDSGVATEHVMFTGNWRFQNVTVTLRDDATVAPEETNNNLAWLIASERYNNVANALSRLGTGGVFSFMPGELNREGRALAVSDETEAGDQIAADNSDMVDFTVMWWNPTQKTAPRKNSESNCFESELQFDCICCNSNVS